MKRYRWIVGSFLVLGLVLACYHFWPKKDYVVFAKNYPTIDLCIADVVRHGGGKCILDAEWTTKGGKTEDIVTAIPHKEVVIVDKREAYTQFWEVMP